MNSKVMNKYFKNSPNKPEPVTEGWGRQLVKIGKGLGILTAILGASSANIALGVIGSGFALISHGADKHMEKISNDVVKKILSHPKVKPYIKKHCDIIYNKLSKYYGGPYGHKFRFSKKVPKQWLDGFMTDDITNIDKDASYHSSKNQMQSEVDKHYKHYVFYEQIAEYTIAIYADTDHIQGIDVIFTLQNLSRQGEKHPVHHNIPAPKDEDIKKMGFRKE